MNEDENNMAFECNIDARGKAVRMKLGIRTIFVSIILASLTYFDPYFWTLQTRLGWLLAGGSFVGGAFTMWEARMGWCVVRAMGFKTKI